MFQTRILGTGSYLPERRLTNADIEKLVDTNDEWIAERTGIRERRIAAPEQATSDLAYEAACRALASASLTIDDIDMILLGTVSPDHAMPNTACILQNKFKNKTIPSLDISAACSGFVYGITIADQFIKTGMYKNILVIGAETLSRIVNYKDRETCILFGDGAGAMVVGRAPSGSESRILSSHLHADGTLGHLFEQPAGGSRMPFSQDVLDKDLHFMVMKGREIFKNAVRTLTQCSQEALDKNGITIEELSWLVPHQANTRIIDSVAKYFGIPAEKVIINLDRTGNTSAATIPIAFDEAVQDGRLQRGQLILLSAFGAGLTSGSVLLRY